MMKELIKKHIEEHSKQHTEGASRQIMLEGAVQALQLLLQEVEKSEKSLDNPDLERDGKEI